MFYKLLIIFIIFFLASHSLGFIEKFDNNNKKNIILIGDSIFKNNSYVMPGNSLEDILNNKNNKPINLAIDNSTISDVYNQLESLPNNYNNSNSILFISIGGNDILNHYEYTDKRDDTKLNKIFDEYQNLIHMLGEKLKTKIILTNIYHPFSNNYKDYYPLIDKWNILLEKYANKNNLTVMDIDSGIKDPKNLTDDIEPSKSGANIIANKILKFI